MQNVIVTLGPSILKMASDKTPLFAVLKQMYLNFKVKIFRLNLSHYIKDEAIIFIQALSKLKKEFDDIQIMIDTKGPEVRIKFLEEPLTILKDEILEIVFDRNLVNKHKKMIVVSNHDLNYNLAASIQIGSTILIDDGKISGIVIENNNSIIKVQILNNGVIQNKKKIIVPNFEYGMEFLSSADKNDIDFFNQYNYDIIALSFVNNANQIKQIKALLPNKTLICSKIESFESINNLTEIVEHSDYLMLARGDLALEIGYENVPEIQERLASLCQQHNKKMILATQLLESLTYNIFPNRSEITDIYYAIKLNIDYLMLSNETAVGENPFNVLFVLNKVIDKYN